MLKPIISCLNMPLSDAYIETNDNGTNPSPTAVGSSIVAPTSTGSAGGASSGSGSGSSTSPNGASSVGASVFAAAQVVAMGVLGAVAVL